jgi:hypothetical protein
MTMSAGCPVARGGRQLLGLVLVLVLVAMPIVITIIVRLGVPIPEWEVRWELDRAVDPGVGARDVLPHIGLVYHSLHATELNGT